MCGSKAFATVKRLDAVVGRTDVVTGKLELQRQRLCRIVVVVGHEDAPRLERRQSRPIRRTESSQPSRLPR